MYANYIMRYKKNLNVNILFPVVGYCQIVKTSWTTSIWRFQSVVRVRVDLASLCTSRHSSCMASSRSMKSSNGTSLVGSSTYFIGIQYSSGTSLVRNGILLSSVRVHSLCIWSLVERAHLHWQVALLSLSFFCNQAYLPIKINELIFDQHWPQNWKIQTSFGDLDISLRFVWFCFC